MIAVLLAAAAPMTAIDAERAFAADAQKLGQWTAFRKWAAPEAIMFDPQPVLVSDALKDVQNPTKAVHWWPTASYVSCDGTVAMNTGGWRRPDGSVGYFTTAWVRQADGSWRWLVDHGGTLAAARAETAAPSIRQAVCQAPPPVLVSTTAIGKREKSSQSADHSVWWNWQVAPDGARTMQVMLWTGTDFETVIEDDVPAPTPKTQ